ncbi:hypothetical protein D3C76_1580760 [compost metagenome]
MLGTALGEHLFELRHAQVGVALGNRDHLGRLETVQFALVLDVLLGRGAQLLLEVVEALVVIGLVRQLGQGLLQYRLQGFLIGLGQFALGDLVQALLHGVSGRWFGRLQGADGKTQPQQGYS